MEPAKHEAMAILPCINVHLYVHIINAYIRTIVLVYFYYYAHISLLLLELCKEQSLKYSENPENIHPFDLLYEIWDHAFPFVSGDHLTNELQCKLATKLLNALADFLCKETFKIVSQKLIALNILCIYIKIYVCCCKEQNKIRQLS